MDIRKCIYTGDKSGAKDSVLPKQVGEIHNWANSAPVNVDYKEQKQDKLPTELEMQANEVFHYLELAKLRVSYFEAKLKEIQDQINKVYKPKPKNTKKKEAKKDLEIKKAIATKEALEVSEEIVKKTLASKKQGMWD